jgi:uncharacterized protein YecT (DUF1311 family)
LKVLALAVCCGALALACARGDARAQETAVRASFACARAGTVDEKLICSDPLLSERDLELARLYRTLLAETKDPARAEDIRADQHAWILRRNAECGVFKSTHISDDDRGIYIDCLIDAHDERAADLRAMAAEPELSPEAISTPIRKPLPSSTPDEDDRARRFLVSTGLTLALGPIAPQVHWLDADRVVAIDATRALVTWSARRRVATRTDVAVATDVATQLCADDGAAFFTARPGGSLRGLAIDLSGHTTPAPEAQTQRGKCALEAAALAERRIVVADPGGAWVLNLGANTQGRVPSPRFVTESQGGRPSISLTPPIRMDSRTTLGGVYLDFLQRFVLWYQPARLSHGEAQALLRRWAKFDCSAYWIVDPAQGRTDTRCIPFGGYNQLRPIPVIAKTHRFFIATTVSKAVTDEDWLGFFELEANGPAKRVAPGTYVYAETSPDGCKIALVDAKYKLSIFDACAAFPG